MKPMDVAKRLNIGRSTVAAWSKEFAEFLSPTAAGEKNQRRDFTTQDLTILAVIKQMTDRSQTREQIGAALHTFQAAEWRTLPALDELLSDDQGAQLVPLASARTAFQVERSAYLRDIARLENDVRELKAELAAERGDKRESIIDLERRLARTEFELEMYKAGRLKPE